MFVNMQWTPMPPTTSKVELPEKKDLNNRKWNAKEILSMLWYPLTSCEGISLAAQIFIYEYILIYRLT